MMKKFILFCLFFWMSAGYTQAQSNTITLDENKMGEITRETPVQQYVFTAPHAFPVTVTVRSLSADFAPVVLLYNSRDQLIARARNPVHLAQRQLTFTPTAEAEYTIEILSTQGEYGQFVVSVNSTTAPPLLPVELQLDSRIQDRVLLETPIKIYQLRSDPAAHLMVQITSELPDGGAAVEITDVEGNPLGMFTPSLRGGMFLVPAGIGVQYQIMVLHSGLERIEPYVITVSLVGTATGDTAVTNPVATPEATPAAQLVLPTNGVCVAAATGNLPVNIRRGPGTDFNVIAGLQPGTTAPIRGRTGDNQWWQIEFAPDRLGWVYDEVIQRGGDCSGVLEVEASVD